MTFEEIKKFAKDASELIEKYQTTLSKVASERDELLAKQASAPEVKVEEKLVEKAIDLNAEALKKAASAVHTALGSPSNISVDAIADCWKDNPNRLVDTIQKLASDRIESTVAGARIGSTIQKRSSAEVSEADTKADDGFWAKYN